MICQMTCILCWAKVPIDNQLGASGGTFNPIVLKSLHNQMWLLIQHLTEVELGKVSFVSGPGGPPQFAKKAFEA